MGISVLNKIMIRGLAVRLLLQISILIVVNCQSFFPAKADGSHGSIAGSESSHGSHVMQYYQHDAHLLHLLDKFCKEAPEESSRKFYAQKQLAEAIAHRAHVDSSIKQIGQLLFGNEKGPEVLKVVRPAGKPLVDDWTCLKSLVKTFETYCGSLSYYGLKHMRAIANICNEGVTKEQMANVSAQACPTFPSNPWSSLQRGFTTLNRLANDSFNIARVDSLYPVSFSNCSSQCDAELLYFWEVLRKAPEGSSRKFDVQKEFGEVLAHRVHVVSSIKLIGQLLFGIEKGPEVLKAVRPAGKPLVDDWTCYESFVRIFETYCGSVSHYGMQHMGAIVNICNEGVTKEHMAEVSAQACPTFPSNPWSSIERGFTL